MVLQGCQRERPEPGPPYDAHLYTMPRGTNVHLSVTYRLGSRSSAETVAPVIETHVRDYRVCLRPDTSADLPERYVGNLELYKEFGGNAKILILGQCHYTPETETLTLDIPHAFYNVPDAVFEDHNSRQSVGFKAPRRNGVIRLKGNPLMRLSGVRSTERMEEPSALRYAFGIADQEGRLRRQDWVFLDEEAGYIAVDFASQGLFPLNSDMVWRGMTVYPASLGVSGFSMSWSQEVESRTR